MAKIDPPFSREAFDLVKMAPSDPNTAAKALLMAADLIRRGERLPVDLANFLADGIETAMRNPARHDPHNAHRGRALVVALHLEANNRRPAKADGYTVHNYMMWLIDGGTDADGAPVKGLSQNDAAKWAADEFDISVSTAKRLYRKWDKKYKEVEADMKANPDNYL
jgi:hypothetical protein